MKRALAWGACALALAGCSLGNFDFNGRSDGGATDVGPSDSAPDVGPGDSALDVGADAVTMDARTDAPPDMNSGRDDGVTDTAADSPDPGDTGRVPAMPRQIAPLSTSRVRTQTPTLRWTRAPMGAPVRVAVQGPGATGGVAVRMVDADSTMLTGASGMPLMPGVYFWTVSDADGANPSPRWSFRVPAHAAGAPSFDSALPGPLDMNNDGLADLAIGVPGANAVVLRLANPRLSATGGLPGGADQLLSPATSGFGYVVASAGDLNGDGFGDLAVGSCVRAAAQEIAGHPCTEQVQVFFGNSGGTDAVRATPVMLSLGATNTRFGSSIAGLGDVDGDGYGDLLVGAPGLPANTGAVHLFMGGPLGPTSARMTFTNPTTSTNFGSSVDAMGDVGADGLADAVIGSNGNVFMLVSHSGVPALSPAFPLPHAPSSANFGLVVASGGDMDCDGRPDVAVSSYATSSNSYAVQLYSVVAGMPMLLPELTRNMTADPAVTGLSMRGDTNGDGCSELLMGMGLPATGSGGVAFLVYGDAVHNYSLSHQVSTGDGSALSPVAFSVALLGDSTGDNLDEFVLGSPGAAPVTGGAGYGIVSLYPGGALGTPLTSVARWPGSVTMAHFGYSVGP